MEQWVRYGAFGTVRPSDRNLLQGDDFGRGDCVGRPVPVRLANIGSRLRPGRLVDGVGGSNLLRTLLQNLLESNKRELVN